MVPRPQRIHGNPRNRVPRRFVVETRICMRILRRGRTCKRILAIHIYRGRTALPRRRFCRSVRLFLDLYRRHHFVPPPFSLSSLFSRPLSAVLLVAAARGREGKSFVRGRTSVARKNICVIIYHLERKIEIFPATLGPPRSGK